ncbi:hypothetical protein CVS40_4842 [Lucilia cuprina]|nr:hypothetical protein CVS40_4842 [Lucilia cuprina]
MENMGNNNMTNERGSAHVASESELNSTVRQIDERLLSDDREDIPLRVRSDLTHSEISDLISEAVQNQVLGLMSTLEQNLSVKINETISQLINRTNLEGNGNRGNTGQRIEVRDESQFSGYSRAASLCKPLEMHRWNIFFSGDDKTLRVDDFVRRVEHISSTQGYSLEEVAKNLYILLKGQAANWYFQWVQRNRNISWDILKSALQLQFRSGETDYDLEHRMINRLQKHNETFDQFYNIEMLIFIHNSVSKTLPEFLIECRRAEKNVARFESGNVKSISKPKISEVTIEEDIVSDHKVHLVEALSQGKTKNIGKRKKEQKVRGPCSVKETPENNLIVPFYDKWMTYNEIRRNIFKNLLNTELKPISNRILKTRQRHRELKEEHRTIESTILKDDIGDIRPYADVELFGEIVTGLLDSGATISVLGLGSECVKTANGSTMPIIGKIVTTIKFREKSEPIILYIAPGLTQKLYLGFNFWKSFGLDSSLKLDVQEIVREIDSNAHILTDIQTKQLHEVIKLIPSSESLGLGRTTLLDTNVNAITTTWFSAQPILRIFKIAIFSSKEKTTISTTNINKKLDL